MTKRSEELAAELAQMVANGLVGEMESALGSSVDQPKVFTKHYHRIDDPSEALPFLQAVSFSFNTILAAFPFAGRHFILVLTPSAASQTSNSVSTVLLSASDAQLVQTVGDGLKMRLGVRGGGKGTRWSGKRVGVWKESKEGVVLQEILSQVKLA
jgi:misacylated tRNA(Ala) deacylase